MSTNGGPVYQRQALEMVLDEVLGLFTGSGVAKSGMRELGSVVDLVCEIIDDLEQVAKEKRGIGQLLYEKRRKLYKVGSDVALHRVLAA